MKVERRTKNRTNQQSPVATPHSSERNQPPLVVMRRTCRRQNTRTIAKMEVSFDNSFFMERQEGRETSEPEKPPDCPLYKCL